MTWRVDSRFAGAGGQGLALAAVVVAEAGLASGYAVALTQEYGPEARGGASRADVVLSDEPIANPQCGIPDILLALHDKAWHKFARTRPAVMAALAEGRCTALVDADLVRVEPGVAGILALPFEAAARTELRAKVVANMIGVGAFACVSGRFSRDAIEEAVAKRSPEAFRPVNRAAVRRGWDMAAAHGSVFDGSLVGHAVSA